LMEIKQLLNNLIHGILKYLVI